MENHSVCGYLKRRSTEELKEMLVYYLQEENYTNNEQAILEILCVLNDRFEPHITIELVHRAEKVLLRHKSQAEDVVLQKSGIQ